MARPHRAQVLLALLLTAGCGSCQPGTETDEVTGGVRLSAGAQVAAATKGRIAVPTLPGGIGFPATPELPPLKAIPPEEALPEQPPLGDDCVVIIDAAPDFGEPPLAVSFSVESRCPGGTPSYTWDFGDGSPPSSDPAPAHVYEAPGDYLVSVEAVTPDGARATDDIDITVEESFLP